MELWKAGKFIDAIKYFYYWMPTHRCLKQLFCILLFAILTLPLQAICSENIASAKVLRVVDGDTLKVSYQGKQESVRLIGIDAPESRRNKKAKNDAQRSGEDSETIIAMGKEPQHESIWD